MTRIPSATGSGDSHETVDTTRTSDTTELDGAPDVFLHLRDLDPGVAEALAELAVVSYDVVPYRDKTKAVRLQVVDAAAYAQLVLENQGRTLSVQDAAVELGRLRAIPLPPRASEEANRV